MSVDPEFISRQILPKYIRLEESHNIYLVWQGRTAWGKFYTA